MYSGVEIAPYKRNMGVGLFDSEHGLTFDPSSAVGCADPRSATLLGYPPASGPRWGAHHF